MSLKKTMTLEEKFKATTAICTLLKNDLLTESSARSLVIKVWGWEENL